MSIDSQGKLEKSQEKSSKSQGILCLKFGRHPDLSDTEMIVELCS